MDPKTRIEAALETALARAESRSGPPLLSEAMRHAVFPGGQRIRPRLCLSVAMACGDDLPRVTDSAGAAIEILHCASLVHDDLPTFDNADTRRGKATIHKAFNEPLAVLAGDALIVLAFQALSKGVAGAPDRLVPLVNIFSEAVGAPHGICAGQAWESESEVDLVEYQRAKTGALFAAATEAGAAAAGYANHPDWRVLGEALGEAYQVADDLRDIAADPEKLGKPVGQDEALGRPNAVHTLGLDGAVSRLERLVSAAVESIPACPGRTPLQAAIKKETASFMPDSLPGLSSRQAV